MKHISASMPAPGSMPTYDQNRKEAHLVESNIRHMIYDMTGNSLCAAQQHHSKQLMFLLAVRGGSRDFSRKACYHHKV